MRKSLGTMVIAFVAALSVAAAAGAVNVTAEVTAGTGTRTMSVKSAGGGALSLLDFGSSSAAPFMVSVADAAYDHAGYQVSMTVSNFYKYASGSYDCDASIPSSSFTLGFQPDPTTVYGVSAKAAPTVDLAGTLTGTVASLLGVASGTAVSAANVQADSVEGALSGVLTGAESTLPVSMATGAGGAFTSRASHAGCDPSGSGAPTSRTVASAGQNTDASLFAWVKSAIEGVADQSANGVITATELVATGVVSDGTMNTAVRNALDAAGVDLNLLDSLIDAGSMTMTDIYDLLTATVDSVTSLTAVSGSYVAVPKLTVAVPDGTAAGDYRGTLTVTLVDV